MRKISKDKAKISDIRGKIELYLILTPCSEENFTISTERGSNQKRFKFH